MQIPNKHISETIGENFLNLDIFIGIIIPKLPFRFTSSGLLPNLSIDDDVLIVRSLLCQVDCRSPRIEKGEINIAEYL